ncbi:MAG: DUF3576 domain-containing protein [Alphaproteobacteria bacterium]|nr:DUF3576 domain-containing protein [Alphaproteobacteria bacterium]
MAFFRLTRFDRPSLMRLLAVSILAAPLAACGGGGDRAEITSRYQPIELKSAPDLRVNGYLWQATLDTLSFMPLQSTDAAGGVIITDWYINPQVPGERLKVAVTIEDAMLRADALDVIVNRQRRDASGDWVTAPVKASTVLGLEDAILTRARQIRIDTVTE